MSVRSLITTKPTVIVSRKAHNNWPDLKPLFEATMYPHSFPGSSYTENRRSLCHRYPWIASPYSSRAYLCFRAIAHCPVFENWRRSKHWCRRGRSAACGRGEAGLGVAHAHAGCPIVRRLRRGASPLWGLLQGAAQSPCEVLCVGHLARAPSRPACCARGRGHAGPSRRIHATGSEATGWHGRIWRDGANCRAILRSVQS